MSVFEVIVLALLVLQTLMVSVVFGKVCLPSEQARNDAEYERELERGREKNGIDEGITNIMSYSVNGKTGFEDYE